MENLVVGDKGCTFAEVVLAMEKSSTLVTVFSEWRKFARVLGTDLVKVQKFQNDLLMDKMGKMEVIEQILVDWRCRIGRKATLAVLLALVEEHFKWQELTELFREMIKEKAVVWSDLDERSKMEVLKTPLDFLGRKTSLSEISKVLGAVKMNTILQSFLKEDELENIFRGTPFTLGTTTTQPQLPYYVQRTLTLQRQLDPKIFKETCSDVFLVKGIQQSHLSRLASPEKTDLSRNQLDEITHRFILLECENNYDILRKKTFPIHRIEYVNGNLFWMSTEGSVDVIRKHLLGSTENISENEMVTQKLSIHNSRPVAIADCPGMGKTTLLSEIARQVAQHYPERYVLTLSLPHLFSSMKSDRDEMSDLTFLKRSLANSCSNISLGQEILFELMNCEAAKFEVFLDAYDEIPSSQIRLAEQMLEVLLHSNNLRAFITSRTCMRDSLEQTVGVVGWDMKPFSTTDQINFFVRYWTIKFNLDDTTRVQEFACDLVEYLQSHEIFCGENDSKDFVGIPIKCFVLADLYSADALRHVTSYSPNPVITFKFSTLCGMYQKFLTFRLEKIPDPQKAAVKHSLGLAAIQLLFPTWLHKLKDMVTEPLSGPIDTKLLLSVGILHSLNPIKFIHRTFAEFLVADFIVSNLLKKQSENCGNNFVEFIFRSVFASLTSSHGVRLTDRILEDFVCVLESSAAWSQIDAEFKNLAGVLGLEKYYDFKELGSDRRVYLTYLLRQWDLENGKSDPYRQLINLLRNETQWPPDVIDKLENMPSAQQTGYQHPTIAYFVDAILNSKVKQVNFDNVALQMRPYLQQFFQNMASPWNISCWFFENAMRCATRGFLSLLKILFGISNCTGISFNPHSLSWADLVMISARHQVSFFEALSRFVESLYGKDLSQLHFGRDEAANFPYTPLHAAVSNGNYPVVEYLVNNYGTNMISASKGLLLWTVFRSVKDSSAVVSQRVEIIRLLVDSSGVNIVNEFVLYKSGDKVFNAVAVTADGIHVKLFKYLIELGADTGDHFDAMSFVRNILPNLSPEDLNEMVNFLADKNLLRLMFRNDSKGVSGLEQCIAFGNLRPQTLQKIHECHNFSLENFHLKSTFLSLVAAGKWPPEMMKSVVKIFNNVDLSDQNNWTLLNHAAYKKSLTNIKYLISAGANVNHISANNWSPLSLTVYVDENVSCDPSLIHDCIQVLLAAGADVNVKNSNGITVLDLLECKNWKLNLQKETIDLLIHRSADKYFCTQSGTIQRRKSGCISCIIRLLLQACTSFILYLYENPLLMLSCFVIVFAYIFTT